MRALFGPDGCVPLTCAECDDGVIFQNGSDEQWSCVLCGWKGSSTNDVLRQIEMQKELASEAASLMESIQTEGLDSAIFGGLQEVLHICWCNSSSMSIT